MNRKCVITNGVQLKNNIKNICGQELQKKKPPEVS